MLAKIEIVYISILRVVVLVAASLALIMSLYGVTRGLPALASMMGLSKPQTAGGGSLEQYIQEKKATVPPKPVKKGGDRLVRRTIIPAEATEAAEIYFNYLADPKAKTPSVDEWEDVILNAASNLDFTPADSEDFYKDNLSLAQQLKISKGKKLSVDQVREVISWNADRFRAQNTMELAKFQQSNAEGLRFLTFAAGAFLAFLLIIFTFLFVRVERNLRLVRTVREMPDEA